MSKLCVCVRVVCEQVVCKRVVGERAVGESKLRVRVSRVCVCEQVV